MPKIDEKKEQLNEFRRWQGYCVTVLIALIAFIATQYDKVADFLIYVSVVLIAMLGVVVVVFARKIHKIIKEIGRL